MGVGLIYSKINENDKWNKDCQNQLTVAEMLLTCLTFLMTLIGFNS